MKSTMMKKRVADRPEDLMDPETKMPKKRFFRSRAHCNPLSHNDGFAYPLEPSAYSWEHHYPGIPEHKRSPDILDIGMGFGGLTVALANIFPELLVLGMEIRPKVTEYVRLRIDALREETPAQYQNASCLRTNCMRYLPNFFRKSSMEKIFLCFPDPHFKAKNFRRRIVSTALCSEYAYLLKPGARLYTVTDVEELHKWHVAKCTDHPMFERIPDEEVMRDDEGARAMLEETEESKKVARIGGKKYFAVFKRIETDAERQLETVRPKMMELWN